MLAASNLTYGWGTKALFQDLSFHLPPGQILAVLGPNGVGKTTLLRALLGFLPHQGQVTFDGVPREKMKRSELWQTVAYVPQAKTPPFPLTCLDMTLLGRNARIGALAAPSTGDRKAALQTLERLGIGHLRDKTVNRLSGGELQMVLIARALAAAPRLLILDEPESNLDFRNQLKILTVMTELAKEDGIACLFNTHYPAHAFRVADQALLLAPGGARFSGPVAQALTKERIGAFFGVEAALTEVSDGTRSWKAVTPLRLI